MGMDVYGRKPSALEGEYFRRNVWNWRALADYCRHVAPEECRHCKSWNTNDRYGLKAKHAIRLADRLQEALSDGSAAAYIAERDAYFADHPNKLRFYCGFLAPDDVARFIAFLRASGGFRIL